MIIPSVYRSCVELESSLLEEINKVNNTLITRKASSGRLIDSLDIILQSREGINENVQSNKLSFNELEVLSESQMILDNCEYLIRCTLKGLRTFTPFFVENLAQPESVLQKIDNYFCTYLYTNEQRDAFIACYLSKQDAEDLGDIRKRIIFNPTTRVLENESFISTFKQ